MKPPQRFVTSSGRVIYSFSVRSFPTLVNNIYIIDDDSGLILIDCGSGLPQANADLEAGFVAVSEAFSRPVSLADVSTILITHGHIDHMGAVAHHAARRSMMHMEAVSYTHLTLPTSDLV